MIIQLSHKKIKPPFPDDFQYIMFIIPKNPSQEEIYHFYDKVCEKLFEWDKIHRIFIHCETGIQFSSAVMVLYLMKKKKINFQEAYYKIQEKRPCISINDF